MSTYSLNRAKASEFLLEIMFVGVIAQTSNYQGLERITTNVRVFSGFIYN